MTDSYRIGPKGFTRTSEVRAILDRYEHNEDLFLRGGMVRFQGLPVAEAAQLLRLLPAAQAQDQQNVAPTFQEFISLLAEYEGATLHGYRITPERSDERITIEGFQLPAQGLTDERVAALMERLRARVVPDIGGTLTGSVLEPDEHGLQADGSYYAWWD